MLILHSREATHRRLGLTLVTLPRPELFGHEVGVEATVDGKSLPELLRAAKGLQDEGYLPASLECMRLVEKRCDGRLRLARPSPFAGDRITVLVGSCGDWVSQSLAVAIHDDGETVRWSWLFRYHDRYADIENLAFERRAYFKAVARLGPAIGSLLRRRNAAWASAKEAVRRQRGRAT
ncbi:MAG: hypothetical protein AAF637_10935 [Pseudomonadota bacterium]